MTVKYNTTRKAFKNPFAKINKAAIENGGSLPDDIRKKMMKEAIEELKHQKQEIYEEEPYVS